MITLAAACALFPATLPADDYVSPGQFIDGRTLVSFWSKDCAACTRQLPILVTLARYHPTIHVAIVVLPADGGNETIPTSGLPANLRLFSVTDGATSLRAFGATQSMLPFSAFMHTNGSVCQSHAGVQGLATFEDWMKKC